MAVRKISQIQSSKRWMYRTVALWILMRGRRLAVGSLLGVPILGPFLRYKEQQASKFLQLAFLQWNTILWGDSMRKCSCLARHAICSSMHALILVVNQGDGAE